MSHPRWWRPSPLWLGHQTADICASRPDGRSCRRVPTSGFVTPVFAHTDAQGLGRRYAARKRCSRRRLFEMLPVFDVLGHWNLVFFWVVFLVKIFWLGFGPEAVSATNISQITDLSFGYFLYSSHRSRFFYPFFFPANSALLSLVTRWQQHWDLVKRMRMSVTPVRSTIKLAHDVFLDSRSEAQRHFRHCWRAHTSLSQRRWMRPFFFLTHPTLLSVRRVELQTPCKRRLQPSCQIFLNHH